MKPLKITVVGDGAAGKSCLIKTFIQNEFPSVYGPTGVFAHHEIQITVGTKEHSLTLWDTQGQENYEVLRPMFYQNTDCFLLCYSIASKTSFRRVLTEWNPEIQRFCPNVPIVLVGLKSDLRVDGSEKFVTKFDGENLKRLISASAFVECSAIKKKNLEKVFGLAVKATRTVEKKKTGNRRKKSTCSIS